MGVVGPTIGSPWKFPLISVDPYSIYTKLESLNVAAICLMTFVVVLKTHNSKS